jgi:hypothetical protein
MLCGGNSKILAKIGNSVIGPLVEAVQTAGKVRVIEKGNAYIVR